MAVYNWSLTVVDGEGDKSTMSGHVDRALHADALTAVSTLAELLVEVIRGRVTSLSVASAVALPGTNPTNPDPASDREEKGALTFLCANNKRTRITIPTLDPALRVPQSDRIDDADASLAALIGHIIANGFTDSNGSDIVALESALEAWGKRS